MGLFLTETKSLFEGSSAMIMVVYVVFLIAIMYFLMIEDTNFRNAFKGSMHGVFRSFQTVFLVIPTCQRHIHTVFSPSDEPD